MIDQVKPEKIKNAIGIMGGGQLALMLADAAARMGVRPVILTENTGDPAARNHPEALFGSPAEVSVLSRFFSLTSQVIMENEFQNCDQLRNAAFKWKADQGAVSEPVFYPPLACIELIQDKLGQKGLLRELDVPTAEYQALNLRENILAQIRKLIEKWGGGCVLKWSRSGYDGKGVLILKDKAGLDIEKEASQIESFCQKAEQRGGTVFAERAIDYEREVAMVAVRSIHGEFTTYPLVVTEQETGICSRVFGPATSLGVQEKAEKLAAQFAQKVAEKTQMVGAFALEFFELKGGALLVNEMAPRVHNSGHFSQDACSTDQFENHIRAILGLPLGQVDHAPGFAMVNLLGPCEVVLSEKKIPLPRPSSRSHLHWYGKKELRPGRKMGHLNGVVQAAGDLQSLVEELEKSRQIWIEQIKTEWKTL